MDCEAWRSRRRRRLVTWASTEFASVRSILTFRPPDTSEIAPCAGRCTRLHAVARLSAMFVSLCAVERVSLRTTAPVYRALPNLETTARPQERNELLHCLDGKWIVVGWLTVPRTVADVTSDPAVVRIACTELDYDRRAGAQIQQVAVIQQVAAQ